MLLRHSLLLTPSPRTKLRHCMQSCPTESFASAFTSSCLLKIASTCFWMFQVNSRLKSKDRDSLLISFTLCCFHSSGPNCFESSSKSQLAFHRMPSASARVRKLSADPSRRGLVILSAQSELWQKLARNVD